MLFDEARKKGDVIVACIQRRNIVQIAATRLAEYVPILHSGFLERLETVRRKAGAEHIEALESAAAEFCNSLVGIRLQPFRFAEA